jgi:UDP-hydrolysing UDP-N-acetyl-D-glucosamine 2-epimerase
MKRKICVVTTSRADYYILRSLLKEIRDDDDLQLQIIASGMHQSARHGHTYSIIAQDGFSIDKKFEMLLDTDTNTGAAKSVGLGIISITDALVDLCPDILVVIGDRYELFAIGTVALILGIPLAHIHGGETTLGAFDEAVRHSLTKIAILHFAAAEEYRKRIIQMGEHPDRVFTVGAPGLDEIEELNLYSREEIEELLSFRLSKYTALVTYHPVTNEKKSALKQITNICEAIAESDINALFTSPNADPESNIISEYIQEFVNRFPERYLYKNNLGNRLYFSCMKHFALMVGNSSSGIIEAPSFKLPVVNIGNRQHGRVRANNVIDVDTTKAEIKIGIASALDTIFRKHIENIHNPYRPPDNKSAGTAIKEILKTVRLSPEMLKKKFYDIEFSY